MPRKKLKYKESEIQKNLYTFGDEWMTEDKQEYKGLYHKYTETNETYTRGTWDESLSKLLVPLIKIPNLVRTYQNIRPQRQVTRNEILPIQISISAEDIKQGYISRYFLKKANELIFLEISEDQYRTYGTKIDDNLYIAATCKWYITGPVESKNLPIKVPGVIELNTKEIQRMEQTLPGISKKLTNPLQYYTDTDFVVPRDINIG